MNRPPITIVATTYFPPGLAGIERVRAAVEATGSWMRYLRYEGELHFVIADDGSAREPLDVLSSFVHGRWVSERLTRQERHGVGASLNRGFELAHESGGLAAYMVDDWKLSAPYDLTPWADVLADGDANGGPVGMVRLGPPHPWLTGTIQTFPSGWGMRLDRHHFAFGHRPALYHPSMRAAYGAFAEDVNAYDCERLYAERFCSVLGPGIVLALPDAWHHVESVELADVEPRDAWRTNDA